MKIAVLTVPGLYGSGAEHWQTRWERKLDGVLRVEQDEWRTPRAHDWIVRLDREVGRYGPDLVLVGHSLACCLIAMWADATSHAVRGALLVAPTDTEAETFPAGPCGFTPMPARRLPFPSIVLMSADDRFVSVERGSGFARAWGSELVLLPEGGHLSADNGLGDWQAGLAQLRRLLGSGASGLSA
ncbi:alpha/beta hydrolase [Paraburkholderia sp. CNPSo 3281]|uniref:RBBP9/YdeN family alpha/beta hydrolase n=1 Tax=Paraburkholderia sp. CNPSo 3281 TaxID=2940933 RepID=UPI0020B872CC|nr:alpha/beta hydrolase [Paraburkholderia sp. CNPSo 3281]MCP3717384.1 alpha/beta hydrolase [Paraburkholderia sp. CNPSo 3281]